MGDPEAVCCGGGGGGFMRDSGTSCDNMIDSTDFVMGTAGVYGDLKQEVQVPW